MRFPRMLFGMLAAMIGIAQTGFGTRLKFICIINHYSNGNDVPADIIIDVHFQ